MSRPTRVTIVSSEYIGVKISADKDQYYLKKIGFKQDEIDKKLMFFDGENRDSIFSMLELLRDMNIPFSTHRTGGADYTVETFRERGYISGTFKRINFFGNDTDEDAPFAIEEY